MTELLLIRGVPGSGKTTLARQMVDYRHVEADMFFVRDGVYRFDADLLPNAHRWCQHMAETWLMGGSNVVVSNTFTRAWEMCPYLNLGYATRIITCEGRWPNSHGVPADAVERMISRWEPTELVDYL